MTELLIKLWAIDAISNLNCVLKILGCTLIFVAFFMGVVLLCEGAENLEKPFKKLAKIAGVTGVAFIITSAFALSEGTAKMLKIGVCAEYIVNLAQSSEVLTGISGNLSESLIKASDLIKLQCFNWEKELQSSKNEGRE